MLFYPTAVSTQKEITIPRGSLLSVGSIGDVKLEAFKLTIDF